MDTLKNNTVEKKILTPFNMLSLYHVCKVKKISMMRIMSRFVHRLIFKQEAIAMFIA
jgi:hypothetical protein